MLREAKACQICQDERRDELGAISYCLIIKTEMQGKLYNHVKVHLIFSGSFQESSIDVMINDTK